jgi:hypothetical protein
VDLPLLRVHLVCRADGAAGMTARVPTRAFLTHLFRDCDGVVEVRALPSGRRVFVAIGDWSALAPFVTAESRQRQTVAVGIATRRDASGGGTDNCLALPAVWADLDHPPAVARRILETFVFPPSTVVASGFGLHAYWRLREAVDLTSPDLHRAASVLRRLAGLLDGDLAATDLARVLRLPGSINTKYGAPRVVEILQDEDRVVDVSELDDLLPAEVAHRGELVFNDLIPTGERNDRLFLFARSLRWHGVDLPRLARYVHEHNQAKCRQPLPEADVNTIVKSAWTLPFRTEAPAVVFRADAERVPPGGDLSGLDRRLMARIAQAGTMTAADASEALHVPVADAAARLRVLADRGMLRVVKWGRHRGWTLAQPGLW